MSSLVNLAGIPLSMDTCHAGGFFNQPGGTFNSRCCQVLDRNNAYKDIPEVNSCEMTRNSCIYIENNNDLWERNKDKCCHKHFGINRCATDDSSRRRSEDSNRRPERSSSYSATLPERRSERSESPEEQAPSSGP